METRVFRIPVVFTDFEDFWSSNTQPSGPQGQRIGTLTTGERERLRDRLREQLPPGPDGRISYEAFANAVKGRVPG